MFEVNQNESINTTERDRVRNNELDLSVRNSFENSNGFDNTREIECFTEIENENKTGFINLLNSKNIYRVFEDGTTQKLNIEDGNYNLGRTDEKYFEASVTFSIPPYNSL